MLTASANAPENRLCPCFALPQACVAFIILTTIMRPETLLKTGSANAPATTGIEFRVQEPAAKDLNVDLRAAPAPAVKGRIAAQLEPEDRCRFGG